MLFVLQFATLVLGARILQSHEGEAASEVELLPKLAALLPHGAAFQPALRTAGRGAATPAVTGLQSTLAKMPVLRARGPLMSDQEFAGVAPKTVFMFPGQGAQAVGMGVEVAKEVPAAAELYAKASEILGYDLLSIDDKAKLDTTAVSQPAIFVASMAAVEKLRASEGGADTIEKANMAMGLSLGEYTALAFAGAISFEDGVRITKARGEAMQAASDAASSGMVSVIGLDSEKVTDLCKAAAEASGESIGIANYLCNGNYACSGAMGAVEKVCDMAKPDFGARMAVKLAVAGAFHTDFMAPAVGKLEEVLANVEVKKPRIPVISNVDAKAHSDPAVIKDILTKQVTAPVQWETIMKDLVASGYESGYELGPGKVLSGIMKRVDKKAPAITNIEV